MLLKHLLYPVRYSDMVPRFARPVPVLSMITNEVLDHVYRTHQHRICQWYPEVMNPLALQRYADAVANKGAHYKTVLGLLMASLDRLLGLTPISEFFTTGIRGSMRSNFNQLLYQTVS